jgi:hypothetical protein
MILKISTPDDHKLSRDTVSERVQIQHFKEKDIDENDFRFAIKRA